MNLTCVLADMNVNIDTSIIFNRKKIEYWKILKCKENK